MLEELVSCCLVKKPAGLLACPVGAYVAVTSLKVTSANRLVGNSFSCSIVVDPLMDPAAQVIEAPTAKMIDAVIVFTEEIIQLPYDLGCLLLF